MQRVEEGQVERPRVGLALRPVGRRCGVCTIGAQGRTEVSDLAMVRDVCQCGARVMFYGRRLRAQDS